MGLLDHMVVLFLLFFFFLWKRGTSILSSITVIPIYLPTNNMNLFLTERQPDLILNPSSLSTYVLVVFDLIWHHMLSVNHGWRNYLLFSI